MSRVFVQFVLFLALVICALGVVTAQHRARKLYQALEAEQVKEDHLDVEYGQLQLELSTWATRPRIERIARDRLHMVSYDNAGYPQPAPANKGGAR